ncbi:MAG: hypothetical protein JWR10_3743 [Rubritepida sp.]|nr:hypothetical protein [Rubritepida sp.]
MTVVLDGSVVRLQGLCRVEDAEPLAALLQSGEAATIELSDCEAMHGAVAQVILAFAPVLTGTPAVFFLRNLLLPTLAAERQLRRLKLK